MPVDEQLVQGLVSLASETRGMECPRDETIARLVIKLLKGEEKEAAVEHLASCERCHNLHRVMQTKLRKVRSEVFLKIARRR